MSVCVICKERQAKRFCPALNAKICPVCCARDRMMELACPESCVYLQSGRDNAAKREGQFVGHIRAAEGLGPYRAQESHMRVMALIQSSVVEVRRGPFMDLRDSEILAGLKNALKNLETAETGLIYEHHEDSRAVAAVSQTVRTHLEKLAEERSANSYIEPIRHSTIVEAFNFEIDRIEAHLREFGDSQHYLRFISLYVPWEKRDRDAAKQLIVV
jgi:hypothetical protein